MTAVNDAPVVTAPASATNPGSTFSVSGVSVADPDAGIASFTVRVQVGFGMPMANAPGGVIRTTAGRLLTLEGPLDLINQSLSSLRVDPLGGTVGQVSITAIDNGNSGSGGVLTGQKVVLVDL